MTFFELKANLTLPNIEYTLASGPLEIVIPQIIFNPPLHESSNPDTGVNGAEVIYEAYIEKEEGAIELLPEDFAFFDS